MKTFPSEFESLLNKKGKDILHGRLSFHPFAKRNSASIEVIKDIINKDVAYKCIQLLNKSFFANLKPLERTIDAQEMLEMKTNYSEKLGKTLRMKTVEIRNKKAQVYQKANECGLIQLLNSESLRIFGEKVVGDTFGRPLNNQIICYENNDYVSPHTDHHPENDNINKGYYDIHLMFSNKYVANQLLIYEDKGFLNKVTTISEPSAIAIYRLPFWHYTTPMQGVVGKENMAQRWLLLRSFELNG